MHYKTKYIYIGVDLHKETHTAVIIDCWNEILAQIQLENKPSAFQKLVDEVEKYTNGLTPVFGLEDVGGFGRSLAVYLLEKGHIVKEVNSALSYAQRMSHASTKKNDAWDAYCVAYVLLSKLKNLPDANPQDSYWTLSQLINRRESLVKSMTTLTNQLHEQLPKHYPSYKKFFCNIAGKTALAFWREFPSPHLLSEITAQGLAELLKKHSHNACSIKKAQKILELVESDGDTKRAYQETRDFIVMSIVRDICFKQKELIQIEKQLKKMVKLFEYKLESMPGISTVTASGLISQIGDIKRFKNADKLAKFAGIAPVKFSSAGKGKEQKSNQGNRALHGIFFFLAMQQVQIAKTSKMPRNPIVYEYYQRKVKEGKTKMQALVCVMRRLVNIIYSMMKNKTEYIMPQLQETKVA